MALFSGTGTPDQAFTADPTASSGFLYNGNTGVNQTTIGDGLQVAVNVPGNQIFLSSKGNVLGSLNQLVTALQSGSTADISTATSAVSAAITHVSQQRVLYANTVTQADAQESFLSQETLSLSSQQSSLTGIDLATAATNLTQAQTAHTAVLAAAAKVLPVSLLDYLK
jgi:flagellar hook-associated protein 3 FlgL